MREDSLMCNQSLGNELIRGWDFGDDKGRKKQQMEIMKFKRRPPGLVQSMTTPEED